MAGKNDETQAPNERTFREQMRDDTPERIRQDAASSVSPGDEDKTVMNTLPELTDDELSRLAIVETGTQLPQGSVFLDLNDLERGSFKAIGGQEAGKKQRLIGKNETDYVLWNKLAGQADTPEIERPE